MGRGAAKVSQRSGMKFQLPNEATGQTATVPAPYGGWNAVGNLSNMPPLDAVVMDNIFPGVTDVILRKGSVSSVTGFGAKVKSLLPYESAAGAKIFAATDAGVYNATIPGTAPAAEFSCTSGKWKSINFSNAGGSWLVAVNGADKMRVYNGTTWTAIDNVSTPALTGVTTSNLTYVSLFKKRLWFVEKNSMNLWYLAVDAIAGTATQFPVGSLFSRGGKVIATGNWTIDGGSGADDYFVILTSKGEAAVYQGTDPASSSTWALVGVYYVGTPVGDSPITDYGGDLLIMTTAGLFPASKFLQSAILDRTASINFKVQGAYLDYVAAYGTLYSNWSMQIYYEANMLILNIPTGDYTTSEQFVMNLTTKAWCRFTGWNAACFAVLGKTLYFASGTSVKIGWTGNSDDGAAIQAEVVQAYNKLGVNGQKTITLVRPHVVLQNKAVISAAFDTDFKSAKSSTEISYTVPNNSGIWDASFFNAAVWATDEVPLFPTWVEVPNDLGFLHAFGLRVISSTASFKWTATNYLLRPAGVL